MDNPEASGFLLLTLPDCHVECGEAVYDGVLALECITLSVLSGGSERDVWLVLRVGTFETPVPPTTPIMHDRTHGSYIIPGTPAATTVVLPPAPARSPLREDLDTFEVLLAQYGVVHEVNGGAPAGFAADEKKNGDAKGRLVLVDEADGQVVGELGEDFIVHEDQSVAKPGREKDPVVVELPEYGATREISVHAVRPEESDALLRSAHLVSRGIVIATDVIAAGMSMASSKFVGHTTPRPEPIVFSERTKRNVKRVHKISGQAVHVTQRTTALIFQAVDQLALYLAGSRPSTPGPSVPALPPRKGAPSTSNGQLGVPPPLPPRKPRLLTSVLMSTDMILTTLEQSGTHLITTGTQALSSSMGHRYGKEMGDAVQMSGETARNVGVVYIDARGVGRRALLKRAGKGIFKAKMGVDKEVVFGAGAPVPPPIPPR